MEGNSHMDRQSYKTQGDGSSSSPLILLLRVMTSPVDGWKALKRSHIDPPEMARGSFYPLMALAAAARFLDFFYESNATVAGVLVDAVVVFISFFLAYFAAQLCCRLFPARISGRLTDIFGRDFMIAAMCTMVLFTVLREALPMAEPVLVFLPLYTAYLIFRGVKYLRLPNESQTWVAIVISVMIITFPGLIGWLFREIVPRI